MHGQLEAIHACRGAIQIDENEARTVARTQVVDDLVSRVLRVNSCVEAETVVHEAQFHTAFLRHSELRLQIRVWPRESIAIASTLRRLGLEALRICVRLRVLAGFRPARAYFAGHE